MSGLTTPKECGANIYADIETCVSVQQVWWAANPFIFKQKQKKLKESKFFSLQKWNEHELIMRKKIKGEENFCGGYQAELLWLRIFFLPFLQREQKTF